MTAWETPPILIVDDEDTVRHVIGRMLRLQGYNVDEASCVNEALIRLREKEYGVLLTDHMMDDRTGLDLIIDAENLYPDLVKILLTGFGNRELYRDAINKGAVFSVIEKPSDSKTLLGTVDRALNQHRRRIQEKEEIEKLKVQYHTLFAHTTDLIQCADIDGNFIYVNPAWRTTLGYSDEEIRSLSLFDVVSEKLKDSCHSLLDQLKSGYSTDPFETIFMTKDGEKVYLEGSATSQFQESELLTITCILRDVTERKKASEEIRSRLRQETMIARIAEILANSEEPILVYGNILEVIGKSFEAERGFIYAINEVDSVFSRIASWVSQDLSVEGEYPEGISFDDIPWAINMLRKEAAILVGSGKNASKSEPLLFSGAGGDSVLVIPITISTCQVGILGVDSNNGSRLWSDSEINMLKAASDIIANAWTRQIEIEVRKQKEVEAEQSRSLVIRADRLAALGTMAAGIIHEITQPLNAINVSAQTILYGKNRGWTLESEQVEKSLNPVSYTHLTLPTN